MQAILVSDTNPKGDVTINDLELTALIAQVHLFDPKMPLLDHIHTVVNNRTVQGWANRGSVESATEVGPIQQDLACMASTHQIYTSVGWIKGSENTMADAASRPTQLPSRMFLTHSSLTFLQKNPWRLLTLPSGCRRELTSILHSKRCHVDY